MTAIKGMSAANSRSKMRIVIELIAAVTVTYLHFCAEKMNE